MPFAEFNPTEQTTTPNTIKEPIIIDVPKTTVIAPAPAPAPTTVHLSYPFKQTKDEDSTSMNWSFSFLALFLLVWVVAGIIAFIMSLVCFARGGSALEKIAGFLLALFFGPFYWVYYLVSKSYCTVESATQVTSGGKTKK